MSAFSTGFTQGLGNFKLNGASLGEALGQNIGAISSAAGGLAGGLIGGGYQDGIGNMMGQVGQLASAIPGPWGAAISGGMQVLGGLTNRAFGTKVNQEALNAANQGTNYLSNFESNASNFDDVRGPQTVAAVSDAYKGGWFSKGAARRKNAELRRQRLIAQDWADRSVENNIDNLVDGQMDNLLANYAAFGGPLHTHGADWSNGITIIDNGGTHESNPFNGVPMGVAPDGQPNLVEEGEVIYNDYVYSNRIKVPKSVREKYKLKGKDDMTFADAAKKAQKESEERPNDPISKRGLDDIMNKLMIEQESIREKRQARKFAKGGYLFPNGGWKLIPMESFSFPKIDIPEVKPLPVQKITMSKEDTDLINKGITAEQSYTPTKVKTSPLSALRFVPAIGGAIGTFSDLMGWTNKPDYSNADLVLNAANDIKDVKYDPIGNYLTYNPLDRLFYANQLGAQAGATRRSIMNTSGGNRGTAMAGLLAADYNAQNQLGNLYRQAEEYNANQRERVATFNRGTNMFNAENFLKAAMASRDNAKSRVNAAAQAAAIRDAVDAKVGAARSANLTNLFDSLGDIGREQFSMDMIRNNPYLLYDWMGRYKGAPKARGGFLTIKKRRR